MDPIKELQKFIIETRVAIRVFEIKKKEIEKHQNIWNFTRTIGKSVSIAGAGLVIGSLVLAPFTGGTSIVAATGYGTVLGIGGAVVNIGVDTADFFASKTFTQQISEIFDKRNKTGEKLNDYFQEIEKVSEFLIKDGMNENEAAASATIIVFKKGISMFQNLDSLFKNTFRSKFASRAGGQFWRNMRLKSLEIRKILSNLGINLSRKSAMNFVRNGTIILSSFSLYYDIKSLLECWKSKHPTQAQIEELLENMRKQLKDLEELNDWLKTIPNDKLSDD